MNLLSALLSDRTAMIKRLMKFEALQAEVVEAEAALASETAGHDRNRGASRTEMVKLFAGTAERREDIAVREGKLKVMQEFVTAQEEAWQGLGLPADIAIPMAASQEGADYDA